MSPLTLRRNPLERVAPLSVVTLAVSYAALTLALATEWNGIVRVLAIDVAPAGDTAGSLTGGSFGAMP
jgi:hypothetical protein